MAEKKKDKDEDDENDDAADDDEDSGKPSFNHKILYLGYSEASLTKRRKFSRGTTAIKQIEWCHVLSFSSLCLPERPRKHFEGTNCGNALFNISLPELPGEEWFMDFKRKKECYGKKYRIEVGGRTDNKEENAAPERRTNDTREPFAYHSYPAALLKLSCSARLAQSRAAMMCLVLGATHARISRARAACHEQRLQI